MQQVVLGNVVFNVAGEWDSGTAYPALSWVTHNGSSWYSATDAAAGQEPGINAVWTMGAQGMDFSAIPLATTETPGLVRLTKDEELTAGSTGIVPTAAQLARIYFVGKIEFLSFRPDELPSGWYFCNGDQYALTSPQGVALNSLSGNFKADWGITVSGANISLPNMFYSDGRGYFLRAVDGTSRQVGSIMDDQMRPVTGNAPTMQGASATETSIGALQILQAGASGASGSGSYTKTINFDSRLLGANYNGADTHPLDRGMTPTIFLGV